MAIEVAAHRFGDEAFDALCAAVRAAQAGDPLRAVTVVVERAALGLSARRRLAARGSGVANVRFLRWGDLALELGARRAPGASRRLATGAVELEALRAVLSTGAPPRLAGAREQPGTLRALARTYRELAPLSPRALDALARQSERAADVVGAVRAARERLEGWDDEATLLEAAAVAVRGDPGRAAGTLGAVVAYLPTRVGPAGEALLGALGAAHRVDVIVGMTGDRVSDEGARQLAGRLGAPQPDGAAARQPRAFGEDLSVCAAPTADAEVLLALRHLMRRNAEGVPLGRLAILHGGSPPYPQLVRDALRVAGIPSYGHGAARLAATVAGRVLLGALTLGEHGWRREDVAAWLASGPLLHRGHPVPAASWDALSREAGVVAGLEDWHRRLGDLASSRLDAAQRAAPGAPGAETGRTGSTGSAGPGALVDDARRCAALAEAVSELAARLEDPPATWQGWASWAHRLLGDALGGVERRAGWPHDEAAAFDAVTDAITSLAVLDEVAGPPPTLADFRAALAAELDAAAPQTARAGSGVLAARVSDAVGIDLDVVCVVGMVDGAFPSRAADDVLLPDRERERADPTVPLRVASRSEGRRDFFAAVAGAREAVLLYARADQRTGRPLRPARLVLEVLEHLAGDGRHLVAGDVASGPPDGAPDALRARFASVPSYGAAVAGGATMGDEPLSVADWELRSLLRWHRRRGTLAGHFLVAAPAGGALVRARAVRAARRGSAFTRFDGLVRGVAVPSPAAGDVMSATGLEAYARCPRSYLFGHVLDLAVREAPEAPVELSPLERGRVVHEILERLLREEMAGRGTTPSPRPGGPDGPDGRDARLCALVDEAFAGLGRRGVALHRSVAELERARLLSDLRRFVRADAAYRDRTGASPIAVEARFGWEGQEEVAVQVPGATPEGGRQRTVRFRGRIDRIDRFDGIAGDGGAGEDAAARRALGVIDYKTGRPAASAARGDPDDLLARGTRLQLPVYALGAQAVASRVEGVGHVGGVGAPVRAGGADAAPPSTGPAGDSDRRHGQDGPVAARAGYWFVGARPGPDWIDVDASLRGRLETVVGAMVEGIEGGLFPANPGRAAGDAGPREHCTTCPFDAICPPRRDEEWEAKRTDGRLAGYLALAEPPGPP